MLTSANANVVVENFEVSGGHGHNYDRYLGYGAAGGKESVVVLLCARHEPHLQTGGWENAAVVTYSDLLRDLMAHVDGDAAWRRAHPRQEAFIHEMVQQA